MSSVILRFSPRPWHETVTRAPAPAPKASSNAERIGFGRQTPSNIVGEQLRDLGGIDRLSHPGGAGKIAIGGATEARTVHDPFMPLQLRLYAGHHSRQATERGCAQIRFREIVPVMITIELFEIGRHVAVLPSAWLRP